MTDRNIDYRLLTYFELYLVLKIAFAGKLWCGPGQPHCPLSILMGSFTQIALGGVYGSFKVLEIYSQNFQQNELKIPEKKKIPKRKDQEIGFESKEHKAKKLTRER